MSPNELDLRSTLQQDAQRIDATGDFATAAIGLERRRARRRTAITAAGAALLAVVVPVLFWSPGGPTGVAPATQTPAVSGSTSQSQSPSPSPTGSATTNPSTTTPSPAVATPDTTYALDDTIVVEGRVIHLERGTVVNSLAVLSNGGFVLDSQLGSQGPSEIEILSPAGRTVKAVTNQGGSYVVSRDGTVVVVETRYGGPVVVLSADGTELQRRTASGSPVAVVGEFVYLGREEAQHTTEWNYVTGATRELPRYIAAVSDDRKLAALDWPVPNQVGYDNCWAVIDLARAGFPKLIERCAPDANPALFRPGSFSADGTYLVGSKYIDGGHWFIPAVYRVSDGKDMLGGTPQKPISGWTWRLTDDASSIVISRNTANDVFRDTARNTLQRCSLDMVCTEIAPELPISGDVLVTPRYVVPR